MRQRSLLHRGDQAGSAHSASHRKGDGLPHRIRGEGLVYSLRWCLGQWPSRTWPHVRGQWVKDWVGECVFVGDDCARCAAEQTKLGCGVWRAIKPAESSRLCCLRLSAWHQLGPQVRQAKQAMQYNMVWSCHCINQYAIITALCYVEYIRIYYQI